jgi:hypothetical protein
LKFDKKKKNNGEDFTFIPKTNPTNAEPRILNGRTKSVNYNERRSPGHNNPNEMYTILHG